MPIPKGNAPAAAASNFRTAVRPKTRAVHRDAAAKLAGYRKSRKGSATAPARSYAAHRSAGGSI